MAVQPKSGLETVGDYGQSGWTGPYDSNIEKSEDAIYGPFQAVASGSGFGLGYFQRVAASALTMLGLTNSTGGSDSDTIGAVSGSGADTAINDNFASVTEELIKAKADLAEVRTVLNDLLVKLKKAGGCGVLDNDP